MQVCLFDIDGTLVSSGGAGKAAMEAALASAFGVPADSGSVPFSGRTDRSITRDLFALHGIDDTPDHWQRFVRDYLGHLPGLLAERPGRVMPGIAALLEHLVRQDRVLVGLLTGNIRDGARLKLARFGLAEHFRCGGFGDHHLERDDVAREALAEVHRHLDGQGSPDQIWVIGDTPLDVQCARAIGARVAAIATGWHPIEELAKARPDLLLTDLADPTPLLKQLGG